MSSKTVSIIIVSSGKRDYLESLLDSIRQQTYDLSQTIIINNSLKPDFGLALASNYPEVKLHSSPENLFYGQAINKGIEMAKGDFILCLNDDVILDRRFIEEALRGFEINSSIGMVSGKVLRFDRKTIDSSGLYLSPFRSAKERGYGKKDAGQFGQEGYIFGVSGAVAFYRKEMLQQLKQGREYFDSDFRFFYEDLDLAWRAHNLGWRGYYIPQALAYHARGATARQGRGINKKFARRYLTNELHFDLVKNRYLAIIKNEGLPDFLTFLPLIILYDVLVLIYLLIFRWKTLILLLSKGIPLHSAFRKRRAIKRIKIGTFTRAKLI
jgi:GT2 family glycosyltransferase